VPRETDPPIMDAHLTVGRRGLGLLLVLGTLASLMIAAGIVTRVGALGGVGSLTALVYVLGLSFVLAREVAADRPRLDGVWREATDGTPPAPLGGIDATFLVRLLGVIVLIAFAAALAVVVLGNGWWLLALSVVPAVGVLLACRAQLAPRVWVAGGAVAAAMLAIEAVFRENVLGGLVLGSVIAPQVMAGLVLLESSRLARVWSLEGRPLAAGRAFALGCLLAVPPALMNVSGMTAEMAGAAEASFRSAWMVLYALQPALLEEAWARLFLLPLLFVTFRSASGSTTGRAVFAALLASVVVHGLAHAPQSIASVTNALFTALVYGVPLALLFLRRGLESAIGYHFFIDFVRFGYVILVLRG
jgi:hypothetical protein